MGEHEVGHSCLVLDEARCRAFYMQMIWIKQVHYRKMSELKGESVYKWCERVEMIYIQ
jgi:hypothetical protein